MPPPEGTLAPELPPSTDELVTPTTDALPSRVGWNMESLAGFDDLPPAADDPPPALGKAKTDSELLSYSDGEMSIDIVEEKEDDELTQERKAKEKEQKKRDKKFNEETAILAGDALLTTAFEILSDPETIDDSSVRCKLVNALGLTWILSFH